MSPYIGPFQHPEVPKQIHVHEITVNPKDAGTCDNPTCQAPIEAWDDGYTDAEHTCLCCRPACVVHVHVLRRRAQRKEAV